jgi:hypothetical protein
MLLLLFGMLIVHLVDFLPKTLAILKDYQNPLPLGNCMAATSARITHNALASSLEFSNLYLRVIKELETQTIRIGKLVDNLFDSCIYRQFCAHRAWLVRAIHHGVFGTDAM